MLPRTRSTLVASLLFPLVVACSGTASAPEAGKTEKADIPAGEPEPAKAGGPALVGAPAAVDGIAAWTENSEAGFTVKVPGGDDWAVEKKGAVNVHSDKLDITIMLQHQDGIESDRLDEFLTMIVDSNKRDAPKYSGQPPTKGSLGKHPGARLDGEFDNGTAYATRDYVVMSPKGASAIMVRGPKTDAARVQAVADHVAATFAP